MSTYAEKKHYYDTVLNTDKTTFQTSNDEPTPIDCVEEMMSSIPDTFWKTPDLCILDPCCGNGNFGLVAQQFLSPTAKMVFNDTNTRRLEVVKKVFALDTVDVTCMDFLSEFPTDRMFDLIMANPPYAKFSTDGRRASKNHNLVGDFIKKSLSILKPGGFLLYIVPDNWMSYSDRNTLILKLTSLQFHTLNIHTAKKYFKKIGSSFTWFLLENTPYYTNFNVTGLWKKNEYSGMVNSCIRRFIPLYYTSTVQSLLKKTIDADNEKFHVETSSFLHRYTKTKLISDTQTDAYPYRIIHTPTKTCYASIPHKYQDGYKVFISSTNVYGTFVDDCGMTQSIMFIRCKSKSEADRINTILQHPLYKFLNDICRWGNFNNIRVVQRFPIPSVPDDIQTSFELTANELELVYR